MKLKWPVPLAPYHISHVQLSQADVTTELVMLSPVVGEWTILQRQAVVFPKGETSGHANHH
jgi:hypothetical protein